jgi:hypothetical protein
MNLHQVEHKQLIVSLGAMVSPTIDLTRHKAWKCHVQYLAYNSRSCALELHRHVMPPLTSLHLHVCSSSKRHFRQSPVDLVYHSVISHEKRICRGALCHFVAGSRAASSCSEVGSGLTQLYSWVFCCLQQHRIFADGYVRRFGK